MVMRRVLASAVLSLLVAVPLIGVSGCAKRHRISIESDSTWLATIDRQSTAVISDSGNATFRVAGEVHCVSITNRRTTGFVRVRIDEGAWAETGVPLGTVETCR